MSIQTTKFGKVIAEEAEKLLKLNFKEATNNNDGEILVNLVKEFDEKQPIGNKKLQRKNQFAYCAMIASVIIDRAMARLGEVNTIRTAGAKDWLNVSSRFKFRRDNKPATGAVFMTKTTGEGSTSGYHVGIIWFVQGDKVVTIEGNTPGGYHLVDGCLKRLPKGWDGIVLKVRKASSLAEVIHVEEYFEKDLLATIDPFPSGMDLTGLRDEGEYCLMEAEVEESTEGESSDGVEEAKNNEEIFLYVGAGLALLSLFYIFK